MNYIDNAYSESNRSRVSVCVCGVNLCVELCGIKLCPLHGCFGNACGIN